MKRTSGLKTNEIVRSLLIGTIVGLGFAAVFFSGFFFRDFLDANNASVLASMADSDASGYPLINEVDRLLERHYLRELPSYSQRQYAAIRGILGSLNDSNTFFIDPPVAQSESDVLAGTYGGIGVSVSRDEDGNFVVFPFPNSPASEADLLEGDIIHAINGVELVASSQLDAVDQMLRGEVREGNGVELTVRRGTTLLIRFVEYSVINVPSVLWRTLDDERVGYIQVLRFTSRTPQELDEALEELKTANAIAFILDLRNNSGGLLQESIHVADEFLDGGVVLHQVTNDNETSFVVEPGGDAISQPLVVLVNNRTASAAELVAGAIQDRGRGILIGQNTFGKGTIQQIFPLSDASSIHVTSAEWLTPNRNALDGVGLTPDIVMIPDENGRDIEVGEALQHLQNLLVNAETRGD